MRKLATIHRMTTDARKAIFSILLSSDDYMDAFEKILKLKLKAKEERDIVLVIFYCCQQEEAWNPFYGFLSERLCEFNSSFKFSFKVCR